jgi:hypothetical protein
MPTEFWNGFYSGVLATAIGFVLTMAWDIWKTRQTERKRDKAVLIALRHECEENTLIAQQNAMYLAEELKLMAEKQRHRTVAMHPFKTGMWEVLKLSIPTKVITNAELLPLLRDNYLLAAHMNEGFVSRQNYKDTSGAMGNFHNSLKGRNEYLQGEINQLQGILEKLTTNLRDCEKAL